MHFVENIVTNDIGFRILTCGTPAVGHAGASGEDSQFFESNVAQAGFARKEGHGRGSLEEENLRVRAKTGPQATCCVIGGPSQ